MLVTPTNKANYSGFDAESFLTFIGGLLHTKGYLSRKQKTLFCNGNLPIFTNGNKIKTDFYFQGNPVAPNGIAISVKHQDSPGSTEEKLYYEILWLIKHCYPIPVCVMATGIHWNSPQRIRAREWMISQIDGVKLINVFFSFDDVYEWIRQLPDCTGFNNKSRSQTRLF